MRGSCTEIEPLDTMARVATSPSSSSAVSAPGIRSAWVESSSS